MIFGCTHACFCLRRWLYLLLLHWVMLIRKSALDEGKYTVSHLHSASKNHLSVWNSNNLWSRCSNIHVKCPLGASSLLHRDSGWRLYDPNKQIDNDFKSDQQIQLLKKQYQQSCPWFGSTLSCCIGGQCRFCGSQIKGKAQGRRSHQASGPLALEPAQIRFALSLQVYKSYSKTCLFPWVFRAYMRYFNLCIGFMSSMLVVWYQMDAGPCQDVVPLSC